MSEADDFAQLMQQIQSAALPEGASASSTPTSSTTTPGLLPNGKKTKGRVKIKMEYISNKLRRYTTFSKRKTGIMKKALELSTLTGTQVMLLVASETGHVYTYATNKLQPIISSEPGKSLIDACLKAQDVSDGTPPCKTEFTCDSSNGNGLMRKRKMTTDTLDTGSTSAAMSFQPFMPTMVPTSLFTTFGEDDYNNDESGDDSDSEEAASDIKEEDDQESPTMVVVKKEEPEMDVATAKLHQTLKEALKAAANNRQQQQKKARMQPKNQNPASKASFVAPFLLQGGANATSLFNAAVKAGDDASLPSSNPIFNFPINFQQLMESAALGVQITNAE